MLERKTKSSLSARANCGTLSMRPRTGEQHVASGDFEKSRHIGRVFGPSISLPRQPAVEAELPRLAYGTGDVPWRVKNGVVGVARLELVSSGFDSTKGKQRHDEG